LAYTWNILFRQKLELEYFRICQKYIKQNLEYFTYQVAGQSAGAERKNEG
jgi:hypothetical protein